MSQAESNTPARTSVFLSRFFASSRVGRLRDTMRQIDYSIGKAERRLIQSQRRFRLSRRTSPVSTQIRILRRVRASQDDVHLIRYRSMNISGMRFNINMYSDEKCLRDFRFRRYELPIIMDQVGWTSGKTKRNGYVCDPLTATCVLLRRLATPCRLKDLEEEFGLRFSALSEIFWEVCESLHEGKGELVTKFRKDLMTERASYYAECVHGQGASLDNCVGFIDGTKIRMARPGGHSSNQRCVYTGHKRCHCLTYQTITTPDGLIFHLFGPIEGRRPDAYMFNKSVLGAELESNMVIGDKQYNIYGDAAYLLRAWLQTAFPRQTATEEEKRYNKSMSAVRIAVEWSYGEVKKHFTSQDFARKLQVRKAPIAVLYICSVLLWNFKTCLRHGGLVPSKFQCVPPSLETYCTMPE